ncbi:PAS domain-containing protein [Tautonia plasticadhaerens]|uniref:PAS fold protein n=1 Tax=Tautonia plasticadhaerens TaxID=2527974 RepID=A0A518HCD2_9BACT|nr:PAS domain-containing protein [Tautonia plasticadhaerens]QDV38522.1 PAS fold protein [Tautonia plasticadhaerens]
MTGDLRTILNVHGDGETRAAVSNLLRAEGMRPRDLASADEVLAVLRRPGAEGAGLALVDASLDEAEPLCRALKGGPGHWLPLLLTRSADADPPPSLSALADDVLQRPPDPGPWMAAVRAWLRVGARLSESRAEAGRWREMLEAMEEGLAMVGPDGAIRWCNPALAELLGAEPRDLVGHRLADRASHLIPPGRPWPLDRTLRGGGRLRDEWELGRRWLRSTSAPLRDDRGAIGGAVASLEDVSAEVHLRQRVARVEGEAAAREQQIEQLERDARLYQALAGIDGRPGDRARHRPSMSQALPGFFCDAVEQYGRVLDLRLRRRGYLVEDEPDGSAELTTLAERLADAGAGPRDVVELHALALRQRSSGAQSAKARAFAEEAKVAVLELMGRLAEHYRAGRGAAARPVTAPPGPSPGPSE